MQVDQEILKKTINHFIISEPKTTLQKIKEHFGLINTLAWHALLKDENKIKDTIAQVCHLANIEVSWFRSMYKSYYDFRIWEEKMISQYDAYKK